MADSQDTNDLDGKDAALLKQIREDYTYYSQMWKEAREERKTDLRYLCGDPWDPADKKAREGRPCISHDELNQYVNQCVNSARQNKRGIKVEPAGDGATDKSAEFRQDLIRTIQYKSKAQSVFLRAFQDEVEGGYGFARVSRRYVSDDSFDQEIVIKPIQNPDSVLYSPDCKEADWSDAEGCFVVDPISRAEFKRRWPNAKIQDFGHQEMMVARDWIQEKTVLVAEYWRIETKPGKLFLLEDGTVSDKVPDGQKPVKEREAEKKTVVQYMTNGIEILERTEQPGTEISIVPFIGLERFVDDGAGPKRKLFSMIRLAREPQMSLAYLCSQQMEEAGMSPKASWIGYVGQFETDAESWETANHVPHSMLQVDPMVDGANGQVLPLPTRVPFTPNFQAYEVAKDSTRRAIQAAMGISPLPTAAQRQNEKSGVALERIANQQEIGSFHFIDGYDRALERIGRIIESWVDVIYDTEREMGLQKADDSRRLVKVNTAEPYMDEGANEAQHYPVADQGDHDVTVSTGPSYQSQREEAATFLDTLLQPANLQLIAQMAGPPAAGKLLSLAIQMRELGPLGDQMAEVISPDANQAQLQQQFAQTQQQAKALYAYVQQLQGELQKLHQEKQAKVIDNEYKLAIEKMREENSLAIAEINTKAQVLSERIATFNDMMAQFHDQAHDVAMQATQQAHEQSQSQQAAEQAQQAQQQPGEQAQQ